MNETSLFREFENSFKTKLHTCFPCKVIAIDTETARVDVQAVFKNVKIGTTLQKTLETGEVVRVDEYEMPIICDVPIVALINTNSRITMPIEVGNTGLLIISEKDTYNWKNNISTSLNSLRKFNINDGFFLPFINQSINNYLFNAIEINYKGKKIKITDSLIEITGNSKIVGNLEVTGNLKVDGDIEAVNAKITGDATIGGISFLQHKHTSAAPGSPTSPPIA